MKIKKFIKRMLRPKVLKRIVTVAMKEPRLQAVPSDTKVYSFKGPENAAIEMIKEEKHILFKDFSVEHNIHIKINLNTADPYPASTDPYLLKEIIDILYDMGIRNISVGDCSSLSSLPTLKVMKKTGLFDIIGDKARLIPFDKGKWVEVPISGKFMKTVHIPEIVYKSDRIIYLANLKTHRYTDFSMSLKHAVGFMHPLSRYDLHKSSLHEKISEVSLAVKPDLIFLDARTPFITQGPEKGETAPGNCIFAGFDLLKVDLKGYRLLYDLKKENGCLENFTENPFEMRQLKHAAEILSGGGKT